MRGKDLPSPRRPLSCVLRPLVAPWLRRADRLFANRSEVCAFAVRWRRTVPEKGSRGRLWMRRWVSVNAASLAQRRRAGVKPATLRIRASTRAPQKFAAHYGQGQSAPLPPARRAGMSRVPRCHESAEGHQRRLAGWNAKETKCGFNVRTYNFGASRRKDASFDRSTCFCLSACCVRRSLRSASQRLHSVHLRAFPSIFSPVLNLKWTAESKNVSAGSLARCHVPAAAVIPTEKRIASRPGESHSLFSSLLSGCFTAQKGPSFSQL
jgi:hypothetical protein